MLINCYIFLKGKDKVGASVGMMQMWGNNKKAKYLMSFLR